MVANKKFTVSPRAQRDYRVLGGGKPSGADAAARAALAKAHSSRPPDAVHVVKRDRGWAVKTAGRERESSIQPSQGDAIDTARGQAANLGGRLIVHGED